MSKLDPKFKGLSRSLRINMTKEEKRLWYDFLKLLPVTVNRQKPLGKYIVDFFCADARLVIELDGSQHYSERGRARDKNRDAYLEDCGFMVLHFTNYEIKTNFDGVCNTILFHINKRKW